MPRSRSTHPPQSIIVGTVRETVARPAPASGSPGEIIAGPRRLRPVTTRELAAAMAWKV